MVVIKKNSEGGSAHGYIEHASYEGSLNSRDKLRYDERFCAIR